jgi:hypothetical protein
MLSPFAFLFQITLPNMSVSRNWMGRVSFYSLLNSRFEKYFLEDRASHMHDGEYREEASRIERRSEGFARLTISLASEFLSALSPPPSFV